MTRVRTLARLVVAFSLLAGCMRAPVRVEWADPDSVQRELTANVLSTGQLSPRTLQFLERNGLRESFARFPEAALAGVNDSLPRRGNQRRLSALAELSFYHAEETGDRRYFLMSAVYAYALLFPAPGEETLDAADPRVRLAYDLYNRGLTEALARTREEITLHGGTFDLPFGTLDVDLPDSELMWAGHRLQSFQAAADLHVEGIRNRYRRSGIGAPFSAKLGPQEGPDAMPTERFMPGLHVPATLLLRFEDPRRGLALRERAHRGRGVGARRAREPLGAGHAAGHRGDSAHPARACGCREVRAELIARCPRATPGARRDIRRRGQAERGLRRRRTWC